jgi:hypothetical protein
MSKAKLPLLPLFGHAAIAELRLLSGVSGSWISSLPRAALAEATTATKAGGR